jgi:hypothetical protein
LKHGRWTSEHGGYPRQWDGRYTGRSKGHCNLHG